MNNEKKYFLYFHLNPQTNSVFYVGIGVRRRHLNACARNKHWKNYVKKYGFTAEIVDRYSTKEEAVEMERYWIKNLGRKDKGQGELLNYTDGGEGSFGAVRSKETREKMSLAARSRKRINLSDEHKNNIRKALTGRIQSDEEKIKNSLIRIALYKTNPNMGMKGKSMSEETKRKIGETNKVAVKRYWENKKKSTWLP